MSTLEENFKRDLRIFYKNEKAAQSIIALIRYANREDCKTDWITLDLLLNDVITSLSDPEVKIKYYGRTTQMDNIVFDMKYELEDKYYNKVDNNMLPSTLYSMNQIIDEYNIAKILNEIIKKGYPVEKMITWVNEFLSSSMDLDDRVYFCLDILKGDYIGLRSLLKYNETPTLLISDENKANRKKKVIEYMRSSPWVNRELVEIESAYGLVMCNENYKLDFSSPEAVKRAIEIYAENKQYSESIYDLMNSERYKETATKAQKDEDILNMLSNVDIRYIDHYARFLKLDFDPEILLIIAGLMRDNWNSIENAEAKRDFIYKYFLSRKAKDEEEYNNRLLYANKFLEIVNDEKTKQANEAKLKQGAQDRLIKVLSKTLNKVQNTSIGSINKNK